MAKRASICSSSGIPLVEPKSTSFPCPLCGEPIGRSERCRDQGVQYRCPVAHLRAVTATGDSMGQVVVKYKITLDQPEDEKPDYEA